jgi:hypothetical protein
MDEQEAAGDQFLESCALRIRGRSPPKAAPSKTLRKIGKPPGTAHFHSHITTTLITSSVRLVTGTRNKKMRLDGEGRQLTLLFRAWPDLWQQECTLSGTPYRPSSPGVCCSRTKRATCQESEYELRSQTDEWGDGVTSQESE